MTIPVNEPLLGPEESEYVAECLRTGWISTLPSRYAISSGAPGLSPADSRTAFGITTLPA